MQPSESSEVSQNAPSQPLYRFLADREALRRGTRVHHWSERKSGLKAFLVRDSPALGPGIGGVRRLPYASPAEALADARRLAAAMTVKCVLFDLPAGGAKVALMDGGAPEWQHEAAYRSLAREVQALGGAFYTGPDVGTGDRELAWMCEETEFVTPPASGSSLDQASVQTQGPGDLAAATARGVLGALEAALLHMALEKGEQAGSVSELFRGTKFLVQGLGAVGMRLARLLFAQGAQLLVSELDPELCESAREEFVAEIVPAGQEPSAVCDIWVPCALGGLLGEQLDVSELNFRAIVGSANNLLCGESEAQQLEQAERLEQAGVLFLPDSVSSSGALLLGGRFYLEQQRVELSAIQSQVRACSASILARSRSERCSPLAAMHAEFSVRLERRLKMCEMDG